MTHNAAEFENRFWTALSFLLASTCLLIADSPLYFPPDRHGIAWCIICLFTYLTHNYDRHMRRIFLTRASNIRRIKSADYTVENRTNARLLVVEIRKHVRNIDMRWMSSTFLNIFFLPRVLYSEHQIIQMLVNANMDELNLIVSQVELALILYKVKDHWVTRQFNRTKLLELLAKDRVRELTVTSKAILLDALQKMKLSAHALTESYVRNIFYATKSDELSELKCMTDGKGDINSMHRLVFVDMRNQDMKNSLLQHIAKEARVQAAHGTIGSRTGKKRRLFAWRKILSDIDDTLSCSGGSWPKGLDTSFPKEAIYPGVLRFVVITF